MPSALSILFDRPAPLTQAMSRLADLQLLPTGSSAADIQQWSRDIRANALFSARTTHLGYLKSIEETTRKMLSGEINIATARAELQDELEAIGYTPEAGFPNDSRSRREEAQTEQSLVTSPPTVPPADAGSLRDLSSDKRLKLVLETQTQKAENFARREAGMDDQALFQFPAWELVRTEDRDVPRDEMPSGLAWPVRFGMAGGRLVDGRMVALKDDAVWSELGSSTLFADGIDGDTPPYAFNSGMGWRDVGRDEAVELGLIGEDELPRKVPGRFFDAGGLDLTGYSNTELDALLEGFAT